MPDPIKTPVYVAKGWGNTVQLFDADGKLVGRPDESRDPALHQIAAALNGQADYDQRCHDMKTLRQAMGCDGSDLPQLLKAWDVMKDRAEEAEGQIEATLKAIRYQEKMSDEAREANSGREGASAYRPDEAGRIGLPSSAQPAGDKQ